MFKDVTLNKDDTQMAKHMTRLHVCVLRETLAKTAVRYRHAATPVTSPNSMTPNAGENVEPQELSSLQALLLHGVGKGHGSDAAGCLSSLGNAKTITLRRHVN